MVLRCYNFRCCYTKRNIKVKQNELIAHPSLCSLNNRDRSDSVVGTIRRSERLIRKSTCVGESMSLKIITQDDARPDKSQFSPNTTLIPMIHETIYPVERPNPGGQYIFLKFNFSVMFCPILASVSFRGLHWAPVSAYIAQFRQHGMSEGADAEVLLAIFT